MKLLVLASLAVIFVPVGAFGQQPDEGPCFTFNGPWQCSFPQTILLETCEDTTCDPSADGSGGGVAGSGPAVTECPATLLFRQSANAYSGEVYNDVEQSASGHPIDTSETEFVTCSEVVFCGTECALTEFGVLACVDGYSVPSSGWFDYDLDTSEACSDPTFFDLPDPTEEP